MICIYNRHPTWIIVVSTERFYTESQKNVFPTTQQKAWRRKAELLLAQTRWLIPNIQKFRWSSAKSCIQLPKCYSCSSSCFCKQPRLTCPWWLCWTCVSERRSVLFCFIDLLFNGSRLVSLPGISSFFSFFGLQIKLWDVWNHVQFRRSIFIFGFNI